MPYVQVRVSAKLSKEQIEKIATEALESITIISGKTAAVTMAEVIDGCNLYFGSVDSGDCILVDVGASNSPDPEELRAYSKNISEKLAEITAIKQDRIYVKHYANPQWHTGKMFM